MEKELIKSISKLIDRKSRNIIPHPDDAVALEIGGQIIVINIDGWVASTDRPPGMDAISCGYRACANAVSDVLSKGVTPTDILVSLSTRKTDSNILKYIEGIDLFARDYDLNYLGGDINEADDLVIDVVAIGIGEYTIPRSGARIGDIVCWLGPALGETPTALRILLQNLYGDVKIAKKILSRPKLYTSFLSYIDNLHPSASIDCSDGLARTLHLLAEASQVGIGIDRIEPETWIKEVSNDNDIEPDDLILFGGEELGIIFTCKDQILPKEIIKLGRIIEKGVYYNGKELPNKGWVHFTSD